MDGLAEWLSGYPLPFDSNLTNALFIALHLAVVRTELHPHHHRNNGQTGFRALVAPHCARPACQGQARFHHRCTSDHYALFLHHPGGSTGLGLSIAVKLAQVRCC